MTDVGIDYGLGTTNIDVETGIRFGVIHQNDVGEAWYESSEADYGKPTCGECGNEAVPMDADDSSFDEELTKSEDFDTCNDYYCPTCKSSFNSEDAYGDKALGSYVNDGEYVAASDEQGDIFITKSPYYTRAQFCSPCAPGACYLTNPTDDGPKAYCFGPEWFENDKAPYPVYRVSNDSKVD